MTGLTPDERSELTALRRGSAYLKLDYAAQVREAERRGWQRGLRAGASGQYDEHGHPLPEVGPVPSVAFPVPRSWVQLAMRVERSGLAKYHLGEIGPALELAMRVLEAGRGATAEEARDRRRAGPTGGEAIQDLADRDIG